MFIVFEQRNRLYLLNTTHGDTWVLDVDKWVRVRFIDRQEAGV